MPLCLPGKGLKVVKNMQVLISLTSNKLFMCLRDTKEWYQLWEGLSMISCSSCSGECLLWGKVQHGCKQRGASRLLCLAGVQRRAAGGDPFQNHYISLAPSSALSAWMDTYWI